MGREALKGWMMKLISGDEGYDDEMIDGGNGGDDGDDLEKQRNDGGADLLALLVEGEVGHRYGSSHAIILGGSPTEAERAMTFTSEMDLEGGGRVVE